MGTARDIEAIAKYTNATLQGKNRGNVNNLASDSRSLASADHTMFIAIKGEHHNGNDFIANVYEKGVRFFLTDQKADYSQFPEAVFCLVPDALTALQQIGAMQRKAFHGKLIGLTGSNGKTIVKEWLYQILQREKATVRSPRSFNSQLGVPLSLWQLDEQYEMAIIEAGISLPGEMEKLAGIIRPDIGIITNIGPAHGQNFESNTQKLKEKLKLFEHSEALIYRADQKVDGKRIEAFLEIEGPRKISWSLGGSADYSFAIQEKDIENSFTLLEHKERKEQFRLPFTDDASLENILHVIVCLLELGMSSKSVQAGISELEKLEMRLEILKGVQGSILVSDVYNSDLSGLDVALDVLLQQKGNAEYAVLLSDMHQSGLPEPILYAELASRISFRKIKKFFGIGPDIAKYKHLFPVQSLFFKSTEEFLDRFNPSDISNTTVLIKGSRSYKFETISRYLQAQYHKTVLEINVNRLVDNLNYYRSLLKQDTAIMVMVKALSYGSGGHEIAGILQHEKIDYLAVAFADEGVKLRHAGLNLPIMVMNVDQHDFSQIIEFGLEPEIYNRAGLEAFKKTCSYMGRRAYPVHIKLDTGMHRLGFGPSDISWLRSVLPASEFQVKSIFTHLAGSDEKVHDDFTNTQTKLFKEMSAKLLEVLDYKVMFHMLNSAGAERFPELQMDMVRIGIGLYGHGVSKDLKAVGTFKTVISQLTDVKLGESIGYGRTGRALRNSKIATIPVGYADGIDRRLGNGRYEFILKGKKVPTIGNICMDMTMLDVTDISADVGDEVILIGEDCPAEEMADRLGTIVYEILTGIPERVKRVYIRE